MKKRPQTLPAIRPNVGLEAIYRKRLRKLVEDMHCSVIWWITQEYKQHEGQLVFDALRATHLPTQNADNNFVFDASPVVELRRALRELSRRWQRRFNEGALNLAKFFALSASKRTDAQLRDILGKAGFTVDLKLTKAQQNVLKATVAANVALIRSIPQKYLQDVEQKVMVAVQTGGKLGELTKDLQQSYGVTKRRAALIARDQNNKATSALQRQRQVELGISEALWLHSYGGRTPRKTHIANDGKRYDVAKGWYDPAEKKFIHPGQLVNCFPGDTVVHLGTGLKRLWRSAFDGPMIHIKVGPNLLKCTPNHPILTARGWVPARLIDDTDKVVCMTRDQIGMIYDDKNHTVTTFEKLFESFSSNERVTHARLDFHGDLTDGEVDEIIIDGGLPAYGDISGFQKVPDFKFPQSNSGVRLSSIGTVDSVSNAGFASIGDLGVSISRREVVKNDLISILAGTRSNPCLPQNAFNNHDGGVKLFCQGGSSKALTVEAYNFLREIDPIWRGEANRIESLSGSPETIGFGVTSLGYPLLSENAVDYHCSSAKFSGESRRADSLFVESYNFLVGDGPSTLGADANGPEFFAQLVCSAADNGRSMFECGPFAYEFRRVQDKYVRNSSAHIFTMETMTGYYSAGSAFIQAKNCRCVSRSVIPGYMFVKTLDAVTLQRKAEAEKRAR